MMQEAIQIENNAVITYDSNITIQSDGKETEIIKEGAVQPRKTKYTDSSLW